MSTALDNKILPATQTWSDNMTPLIDAVGMSLSGEDQGLAQKLGIVTEESKKLKIHFKI